VQRRRGLGRRARVTFVLTYRLTYSSPTGRSPIYEGGAQHGGSLCFSPKARQVQFFAKYILSAEDNLGALWATDAPPYSRLLGIDELEFADVVTHRYAVAAHAMHQAMLTTTT